MGEYAYESQVIWPIVSAGCNIPSKYTITVGKLIVTNRAVIGTTYVLDPKGQQSIEIFGTDLKPWADRMTFVNCQDTCGVSKPSKLVGFPDGMYVDADDPSVVAEVIAAIEAAEDSGGKKPKNAEEYEVPTLTPLGLNLEYSLYVKVGSGAVPLEPKGAMDDESESIVWSDSSRGDLVQGSGFSTQSVLRFAPLTLPSAGTYKVCFCDSEVSGKCSTNADFSVEIGKVHVSGLSCLLSVPKLQTAQCFEQYFGGLRCVSGR